MMAMGMGPPRGPQGMMGTMAYYNPHDPNMMGLMPVRAVRYPCPHRQNLPSPSRSDPQPMLHANFTSQAPGPMGYGGPAVAGAAPLPQRPGEKECTFYLRTGRCQYGNRCKFHHPHEKMPAGGPGAHPGHHAGMHPAAHAHGMAHGHGMAPGGYPGQHPMDPSGGYGAYGAVTAMRGGPPPGPGGAGDPPLPSRPGADACGYYMRTGKCSYGSSCRYDHPRSK